MGKIKGTTKSAIKGQARTGNRGKDLSKTPRCQYDHASDGMGAAKRGAPRTGQRAGLV